MATPQVPISSFTYVAKGLRLLLDKRIRPFVVIPIAINAILFIGLNIYVFSHLGEWNQWLVDTYLPDWDWLRALVGWLVAILATLGILVGSAYTFNFVAGLIAAPFNGLLAEKAEELLSGRKPPPEKISSMVWRTLGRELRKLGYFIPRALGVLLGCFLLGFVPVIGLIAPFLAFAWAAWSLCIQYSDYCFDNHQIDFNESLSKLRKTRPQSYGFGATIAGASMIPIINWFVMPAAVIGGVVYWVERHQDAHFEANSSNSDQLS
ncbi:MAG: sulfate transporter CysZ [Pseudomonadales bacterium]|jgi:CysZ protein